MPVVCSHCNRQFQGSKLNARHLSKCNPALRKPVPPCLCGHESTSLTQMKRHRKTCEVWKGRDKKAVLQARQQDTLQARYGEDVTNPRHVPGAEDKRACTNLERYGAENVFARESSKFDEVQASLEGKRFVWAPEDNPFSKEETKAKIRQTMEEKYGAENPQQVPEIRVRTRATNMERYGHEETLAVPGIREKIVTTNMERYGGVAPSCSSEVIEKAKQTNMERYGVPWTAMDPEVRRKQLETMEANYGSHFFASDEGKEMIRRTLLEKYGVDHWMKTDGAWEKLRAVFQERFGVDHPLQLEWVREKQYETNIRRYGSPFPGFCHNGPNLLERRVLSMASVLKFTGNGRYWRKLPRLGAYKNPDFVLPGSEATRAHPWRGATKVVEAFGDYWHSRMFTGKAPFEHEQELIEAYAEVGLECLVIWESEIKTDPENVKIRLTKFLV